MNKRKAMDVAGFAVTFGVLFFVACMCGLLSLGIWLKEPAVIVPTGVFLLLGGFFLGCSLEDIQAGLSNLLSDDDDEDDK